MSVVEYIIWESRYTQDKFEPISVFSFALKQDQILHCTWAEVRCKIKFQSSLSLTNSLARGHLSMGDACNQIRAKSQSFSWGRYWHSNSQSWIHFWTQHSTVVETHLSSRGSGRLRFNPWKKFISTLRMGIIVSTSFLHCLIHNVK